MLQASIIFPSNKRKHTSYSPSFSVVNFVLCWFLKIVSIFDQKHQFSLKIFFKVNRYLFLYFQFFRFPWKIQYFMHFKIHCSSFLCWKWQSVKSFHEMLHFRSLVALLLPLIHTILAPMFCTSSAGSNIMGYVEKAIDKQ